MESRKAFETLLERRKGLLERRKALLERRKGLLEKFVGELRTGANPRASRKAAAGIRNLLTRHNPVAVPMTFRATCRVADYPRRRRWLRKALRAYRQCFGVQRILAHGARSSRMRRDEPLAARCGP